MVDWVDDPAIWSSFKTDDEQGHIAAEAIASCGFCHSTHLEIQGASQVCLGCGCIVDRLLETGPEWRYFGGFEDSGGGKDQSRCGMPFDNLLPRSAYNVMLNSTAGCGKDGRITQKYHQWNSTNYRERTLFNIFQFMAVRAQSAGIPSSIIDDAKAIYKRVSDGTITRGANRTGIIATSIYMACKTNHVPRSTKEIAQMFGLDVAVVNRGCKRFQERLNIAVDSCTAADFVGRFASHLNIPLAVQSQCKNMIQFVDNQGIATDCMPTTLAASALLLTCNLFEVPVSNLQVSQVSGVSVNTINKCHNKIYLHKDVLFKYMTQHAK